jgi:ABC-type nitrate/sulfonate/bicarbonate transport system substrate-binding protein
MNAVNWRLVSGVAAVVALAIILGCEGSSQAPVAPRVHTLTLALPTTPHGALLYIAAVRGFLAEEGLAVAIVPAIHGREAVDLLSRGKADLAMAAEVVFVLAAMKDPTLAIAANTFNSTRDLAVVSGRSRGILGPRDFAGKRIGVTTGTAGEYFLWAFLIRNKLSVDSVTVVDTPPGRLAQDLASGMVDAVATWQPNVLAAQAALGADAVTYYGADAYTETFNLIGKRPFMQAHSGAMEKLMRAMLKAERYYRADSEAALRLVATRLEVGVERLRPGWAVFDFRVEMAQSQIIALEDVARWAIAKGYSEPGPVPNFLPQLFFDPLLAVDPARVTVVR